MIDLIIDEHILYEVLIIILYLLATLGASFAAVLASFLFPSKIVLGSAASGTPPSNITEVLTNILLNLVSNPVQSLANANYIGILFWSILIGLALRHSKPETRTVIHDLGEAITAVVRIIIRFAPLGVMGLVATSVAETGFEGLKSYAKLLYVLVGCMAFVALVVNPLLVFWKLKKNPYPLVFTCLKESGITAFFTRSSAANIPVNLALCKKLNIDETSYSVSIPLGATMNMGGAAVTIAILTLAAAHTLNIPVDFFTSFLLCLISAVAACGASGVPGGSLLIIPLACSIFGIDNDTAMQVVGIGAIIGVVQDSCETALNSSSDVLFTAAAEFGAKK